MRILFLALSMVLIPLGGYGMKPFQHTIAPVLKYGGGEYFRNDSLRIMYYISESIRIEEFRVKGYNFQDEHGKTLCLKGIGFGECKMGKYCSVSIASPDKSAQRLSLEISLIINGQEYHLRASFQRLGEDKWTILQYPQEILPQRSL